MSRQHDLQTVQGVFRLMDRPRSGGNALDEMPQAGGPGPQRLAFLVDFPYLAFLGPSLETLRRPIIAEQLQDAVGAVELDRGCDTSAS